ncbi:MAG: hypothetical protein IAE78_05865 [Myxococcus sp.]|nr:hypothetical protein [Myxococcus sp.]
MRPLALFPVMLLACCRSAPSVPEGMEWVTASAEPRQWSGAEVLRLVTPVRPPTSADRRAHILVALRLPTGATLPTMVDERGRASLVMPVGAIASRVEFAGSTDADDEPAADWRVLDVREFEWRGAGLSCVVLRPAAGALAGLRWPCGDDARAGQVLAEQVLTRRFDAPADPPQRAQAAEHLARINGCAACHARNKAEDRSSSALVQRGTDALGLFSFRSLFADDDPVERYRPVDANASDPHLTPVCPGSELDPEAARCRDGLRAKLRLDVARGRADWSRHVQRVCASRRALAERLDEAGRVAWADALAACD